MFKIRLAQPVIGRREQEYLIRCIKSSYISSVGEYVTKFEEQFSKFCGARYGVAASSGTAALHLAVAALGIGPGDEVIAPTFTMIATANAITYTGARLRLVDSERRTWNLSPDSLKKIHGKKTKAIMVVHTYGHPVDMDPVIEYAKQNALYVIEDACEAHGAEYKGIRVGSLGDIACFSFYANKIITTGEGGMVVTNNKDVAEQAKKLRNLFFDKERKFLHRRIGFNYRMTNMQAAVGLAQFERINEFINKRIRNAAFYNRLLSGVEGITTPPCEDWAKNVYWMYSILVNRKCPITRNKLMKMLAHKGIESRVFFRPIHIQPCYSEYAEEGSFPVAEELSRLGLNLPSGNNLTASDIEVVVSAIHECVNNK